MTIDTAKLRERIRDLRPLAEPPLPMQSIMDIAVQLCDELDQARANLERAERFMEDCWSSHRAQKVELDQARADVLKCIDALDDMAAMPWRDGVFYESIKHYEAYR